STLENLRRQFDPRRFLGHTTKNWVKTAKELPLRLRLNTQNLHSAEYRVGHVQEPVNKLCAGRIAVRIEPVENRPQVSWVVCDWRTSQCDSVLSIASSGL